MSQDISKIDKNFAVKSNIDKDDTRFYNALEAPFRIYGVEHDGMCFRRLPENVAETVSQRVLALSAHTAGGRVRFSTDSTYVAIRAKMPVIGKMGHFAYSGSAGFDLYADGVFVKTFVPPVKIQDGYEGVVDLGTAKKRQITLDFPLYSGVSVLEIGVQESATLEMSTEYRYEKPVVFYGSSITQGGCASHAGNCYTAMVTRKLDANHVNLGFSGSGKGETEIAEYIANLTMSAFVYDYDHNAPDVAHLEMTHERMFQIIREKNPTLPILILSRPKYVLTPNEEKRLAVIRKTYENALESGDEHVYFLEGSKLMDMAEHDGTVDGTHPNDLGFASMAKAVEPILKKMLEERK